MGLFDSILNKEKKLIGKAGKDLSRIDALMKSKKPQEALADLERLISVLKENAVFIEKRRGEFSALLSTVGLSALALDRAKTAEDTARMALQFDQGNADAMAVLGTAALRQENRDEAISWHRKAVDKHPESTKYLSLLGDTHEKLGDVSDAIACYRRVLEISPDSIIHYDKILEHEPKDLETIRGKGNALARLKRYDGVLSWLLSKRKTCWNKPLLRQNG